MISHFVSIEICQKNKKKAYPALCKHYFYYFCKVREATIIIALGSNDHPRRHMRAARSLLSEVLPTLRFTRNMLTQPIGQSGPNYLNCLGWGSTQYPLDELSTLLKDVERRCGDTPEHRAHGRVLMDVDLLEYDGERHHAADWERGYIVTLLEEVRSEK